MLHKLSFVLMFAVFTCAQMTSVGVLRPGGCPDVQFQKGFKWAEFVGGWYEHSRFPNIRQLGQKCVYSNYTLIQKDTYAIKVSGLNASNQPFSSDRTANIIGSGVLSVNFASGTNRIDQIRGTDYKSWAVIYSCQNTGKNGVQSAWILTRLPHADANTVANAEMVMTKNKIPTNALQETTQDGCPAHLIGKYKNQFVGFLK